jgi:8-oxo-dGTP pyrophosphatase MutT (NUDIX family)
VCVAADPSGEACYLLTRRAVGLKTHARQWALPGGRIETGEDVVAAARREMREEIGLVPDDDDILGRLDDYPTRSGFVISPIVVWCDGAQPVADPAEVESIHHFPVAELGHPSNPRLLTIDESDRPVLQLRISDEHLLHAPTAAVLLQFHELVVHGRVTRVDHFDQPRWAWR